MLPGIRNSVSPQQGTRFLGSSYDANNSQSTASSYASSKSKTSRVPTQYSIFRLQVVEACRSILH
uniref:Uncharacterized protein n=1 Tax=Oryza brachyantha TaxID=4533 RepID=J3MSF3_ORYBR